MQVNSRGIIAAAAAIALSLAPAAASAQYAPQIQPAAEEAEGNQLSGGFLIPLIVIVVIVLAVTVVFDDDGDGVSPN